MKLIMRKTPLGFETFLLINGALARLPEALLLQEQPKRLRPLTILRANAASVSSSEACLEVVK